MEAFMQLIVGWTEEQAKSALDKAGFDYRIVERNGETLEDQNDREVGRISLKIEDRKVVFAKFE